jgi:hypothetical protein
MGLLRLIAAAVTITNCGTSRDRGTFLNATVYPNPPIAGEKALFTVGYQLDDTVYSGHKRYTTSYNYLPLRNVYSELEPITPGVYIDEMMQVLPSGHIDSKMQWFDQDENQILCVRAQLNL